MLCKGELVIPEEYNRKRQKNIRLENSIIPNVDKETGTDFATRWWRRWKWMMPIFINGNYCYPYDVIVLLLGLLVMGITRELLLLLLYDKYLRMMLLLLLTTMPVVWSYWYWERNFKPVVVTEIIWCNIIDATDVCHAGDQHIFVVMDSVVMTFSDGAVMAMVIIRIYWPNACGFSWLLYKEYYEGTTKGAGIPTAGWWPYRGWPSIGTVTTANHYRNQPCNL